MLAHEDIFLFPLFILYLSLIYKREEVMAFPTGFKNFTKYQSTWKLKLFQKPEALLRSLQMYHETFSLQSGLSQHETLLFSVKWKD